MQINFPHDRRNVLRLMASFSTGALLAGCGGGGGSSSDPVVVVSAPVATTPTPTATAAPGAHPLNLALNLAYLGAQYYGFAAHGTGLSADLMTGVGRAGMASGARQASFTDTAVAGYAAELAEDKRAHVVTLRGQIGALAAAQPTLDLSIGATGAFSIAAQRAGIVTSGGAFDPYAGDENFLVGAFLVENAVAAAYRTLLMQSGDAATTTILSANLADAIYHGGLVRALLDDRAAANGAIDGELAKASAMLAALDGTDIGDQTLAGASGFSSNLIDADGHPIPFTRARTQVLNTLYLSSNGAGGFLPMGANGIPV